jgi:hypothetical protein
MNVSLPPVPDEETVSINGAWLPSGRQVRAYGEGQCGRMGLREVRELARTLVDDPFWDFWWD